MCICRFSLIRENLWVFVIWFVRVVLGLRSIFFVEEVRGLVRVVYIYDENFKLIFMYKDKII